MTLLTIAEANADLREHHPILWVAYNHHRTHKNEPLTFRVPYRCMKSIYRDHSPYLVVSKCTQVGLSEMLVCRAFSETAIEGRNIFYVLPTFQLRNRFVQNRFDKSAEYSPWYKSQISTEDKSAESVNLKHIGRGAISFVGSNTPNVFTEFPADSVFVDEFDQASQSNLAMAEERLSASKDKRKRYVSNPTINGFGIDFEYSRSDKKKWYIKCECGHSLSPDFFQHVVREIAPREYVIRDEEYDPEGTADCRVICDKCGRGVDRYQDGTWVRHGKADVSGYTMSKIFSANVTIKELLTRFQDGLTDDSKLQRFYNGDLGVAYTATGSKIDTDMLNSCRGDYPMQDRSEGPCIIGIDVGSKCHAVVGEPMPDGKIRIIWIGTLDEYEDIRDAYNRFHVKAGVIDAMPETRLARKVCGLRGMFRCFYSDTAKSDSINGADRIVTVDRTGSLDSLKEAIALQHILLPAGTDKMVPVDGNGRSEYYRHMTAATRVFDEEKNRYSWVEGSEPDHYFHSTNYLQIARRMIKNM